MDLGAVKPVSAITSWSHDWKGIRGAQEVTLYASDSPTDPGWDLGSFTPLGTVATGGDKRQAFSAVSLRSRSGQPLGSFRWIVWAVSPVSPRAENTAFQELAVQFVE